MHLQPLGHLSGLSQDNTPVFPRKVSAMPWKPRASALQSLIKGGQIMALIVHWLLSALSILIVAHVVPGFEVRGFGTALVAAIVIGLVNATLGFVLKILTLPVTIL